MKYLHVHECWTNLWHVNRDAVLLVWSRMNLEGKCCCWSSVSTALVNFIKIKISRGDKSSWTEEVQALWEGVTWKR